MKRRLLQCCFVVGLLLTFVTGALWVRGFWTTDTFVAQRGAGDRYEIVALRSDRHRLSGVFLGTGPRGSSRGTVSDRMPSWAGKHERSESVEYTFIRPERGAPWWDRLGFSFGTYQAGAAGRRVVSREVTFSAPWWFLVTCCAAFTAAAHAALRRARHQFRRATGLCVACAYDLRGADHERCPECGAGIEVVRV